MKISVHADAAALGAAAAADVAHAIQQAVQARGRARIIVAVPCVSSAQTYATRRPRKRWKRTQMLV